MLSSKTKKVLSAIYIIFLVISALYVNYTVKNPTIKAETKDKEKVSERIKKIDVKIIVQNGNVSKTYEDDMESNNSVLDLLERLYEEQGLKFEKSAYSYGTELENINGVKAAEGYKWKLLLDGQDITYRIQNLKLVDDKTYILTQVKQ